MKGLTEETLRRISWDWHGLADVAQARLDEDGLTRHKIEIYRKLLMSVKWYSLLDMLTEKQLREALDERVLSTLWPSGVKKKFRNVARIFSASALSIAG